MRRGRRIILPFLVVLVGVPARPAFAGWYFNVGPVVLEGACANFQALQPSLPPLGPFPTRAACDSARNPIAAIRECLTHPQTGARCCAYFSNVTPCSGSDDASSIMPGPGNLTPNSAAEGTSFFTSHPTSELSDWSKETQERQLAQLEASRAREADSQRIGGVGDIHAAPPALHLPSRTETEAKFNEGYSGEASDFFFKLQGRQTGPGPSITSEERERAQLVGLPSAPPQSTLTTEEEARLTDEAKSGTGVSDIIKAGAGAYATEAVGIVSEKAGNALSGVQILKAASEGDAAGVISGGIGWVKGTLGFPASVASVGGKIYEATVGASWDKFRGALAEAGLKWPTWQEAKKAVLEDLHPVGRGFFSGVTGVEAQ